MRLRLDLGYDGTDFTGWAIQPGLRTVQGELEAAMDTVLRTTGTRLTVAGRTDNGVHARGQVAHVDLDGLTLRPGRGEVTPVQALRRRINGVVGKDLRVHRVSYAPEGFDARFSALWRRYAYRIADDPAVVDPLTRGHVLVWPRPLDLDLLNAAAAQLVGLNDFASFCRKRPGATTIRTLLDFEWTRVDGVLTATVRADAFCHSMVRALVGCTISVGAGREAPEWAREIMNSKERVTGFAVSPAHGLTLEEVAYPPEDQLGAQAVVGRNRRTLGDEEADC